MRDFTHEYLNYYKKIIFFDKIIESFTQSPYLAFIIYKQIYKKELVDLYINYIKKERKMLLLNKMDSVAEEIKNQVIPIPGVSALPLGDNMYEWHGNIKSLVNNIYKGAVLHFRFSFPKDYPLSPPSVYLLNNNFCHLLTPFHV